MSDGPLVRTLRARLTLMHIAAMVLVLIVYASAVFVIVRINTSNALDDRLQSDFRWAAEMAQLQPDGTLVWFDSEEAQISPWLQVWSTDGQSLFRTTLARRVPIPESEALTREPDGRIVSVPSSPHPFRILTGHVTIAGRPVVVQVGSSEAAMRQELRELMLVLVLGLPLSVAAAGLGGYWLARGALSPIDRMADRARMITADRLGERLPIENPTDELGKLASIINDTLARLEASFEQMQTFTAQVSHELRTPLTAIRSVGEVGLQRSRDAADYRTVIADMLEDTDRLSNLVERLLLLSKGDTGQIALSSEAIDLCDLTRSVVSHLSVLAEEKEQSLTADCQETCQCRGDRLVLRQALINLVDNAVKYTPRGGQIRVQVADGPTGPTIEVSDTGPGVPSTFRHQMFDRFWRGATDRAADSTGDGLGLALAKWAVEANHGALTYEESEPSGSIFRVRLPKVDFADREGVAGSPAAAGVSG